MSAAHFVLVPGAYRGAWLWGPLTGALNQLGHTCHAVCPIGVGERSEEGDHIGMAEQVADVVEAIDAYGGNGSILIGHSLGGLHASAAAAARPENVRLVIYLDALVPSPGDSFASLFARHIGADNLRETVQEGSFADRRGEWSPNNGAMLHELDDAELQSFLARLTPQPLQTLLDPVESAPWDISQVFIACTRTHLSLAVEQRERAEIKGLPIYEFDSGHDPMWTRPDALAQLLHKILADEARKRCFQSSE